MKPYLEVFLIKVTVILPDLLPLRLAPPSRWLISCLLFIFSIFQETAFSPHPHAPAGISSCDQREFTTLGHRYGSSKGNGPWHGLSHSPRKNFLCTVWGAGGGSGRQEKAIRLVTCLLLPLVPQEVSPPSSSFLSTSSPGPFFHWPTNMYCAPTVCQ